MMMTTTARADEDAGTGREKKCHRVIRAMPEADGFIYYLSAELIGGTRYSDSPGNRTEPGRVPRLSLLEKPAEGVIVE